MAEIYLPRASQPLFNPSRIKILYGGMGGGKTQAAARALVAQAASRPLFIVCLLESQSTIEDSAMRLMMNVVDEFDIGDVFARQKMSITGANRSEIAFEQVSRCGRMLEQADIVWVEDGHNVAHKSWNTILNGARKKGSEVWITMNPGVGNGEAYQRFFEESIYSPLLIPMSYRTNENFPESLEIERQRMLREDPEEYQHVWEGVPRKVEGYSTSMTIVGDDGTVEDIGGDSPMAVLKRISLDRAESAATRIEAARAILPYVHKKQPVAVEGLGQAAGLMGVLTPERMKALSDSDIEHMLAVLQGGDSSVMDLEVVK